MTDSAEPTQDVQDLPLRARVAIIGSCVTRDAFALHVDRMGQPAAYFARSALASALDPRPFRGVDTSTIASPFQRRMVEQDLNGALVPYLAGGTFDVIVYDLIDERFDVLVAEDGAMATRSIEFERATFDASGVRRVRPRTDEYFALWEQGWSSLVERLTSERALGALRVNQVSWASRTESGEPLPDRHTPAATQRANKFLARQYARMSLDLGPEQVYAYPESFLVAADSHQWGVAPYHYAEPYYRALVERLTREGVRG